MTKALVGRDFKQVQAPAYEAQALWGSESDTKSVHTATKALPEWVSVHCQSCMQQKNDMSPDPAEHLEEAQGL